MCQGPNIKQQQNSVTANKKVSLCRYNSVFSVDLRGCNTERYSFRLCYLSTTKHFSLKRAVPFIRKAQEEMKELISW